MNASENAVNESTKDAIEFEQGYEHEIRFYLKQIKAAMTEPAEGEEREAFKPTYLVTAVKLPTGAIELSLNTDKIADKIDYILDAYDHAMCLKANKDIVMQNIMIV